MSQLEFLTVCVSILIALVLAKLIEGFYQAIEGRLLWVHTVWLLNRFVAALLGLWGLSPSRGAGETLEQNFDSFTSMILLMMNPLLMLLSAMLLVSDRPSRVTDWRTHYESIRRPFLVLLIVIISFNWIGTIRAETPIPYAVFIFMFAATVAGDLPRFVIPVPMLAPQVPPDGAERKRAA
jgi:hypothetical protein